MSDINKHIEEVEKRYAEKVALEESKVAFIKFFHESNTLTQFLKEFKDYNIENIDKLFLKTRLLNQQELEVFKDKIESFSEKVFVQMNFNNPDFYNTTLNNAKTNMGLVEYVSTKAIDDTINKYSKSIDYKNNLSIYHDKITNPNFAENYISEITDLLNVAIDKSKFESANNTTLRSLVSDIYYLTKRLADKNVFDFSISQTESSGSAMAVSTLANFINDKEGVRNYEMIWALSNDYGLNTKGLTLEKIEDTLKGKFKETDSLVSIATEEHLKVLEKGRTFKYIPSDTTVISGFTFSKERIPFSDKNIFQIIVGEISKVAIEDVKINRTIELHNKLKEESLSNSFFILVSKVKEFMENDRVQLKEEWPNQLKELPKKRISKIQP